MTASVTSASVWDPRADPPLGVHRLEREWTSKYARSHLRWAVQLSSPDGSGEHRCTHRSIADLTLVNCSCAPCSGVRDRGHVSRSTPAVVVVVGGAGRQRIVQLDSEATLGAGDVLLWDSTLPASFEILQHMSKTSLILPSAALSAVGWVSGAGLVQLDRTAGSARLAAAFIHSLADLGRDLPDSSQLGARNAVLELLAAALRDQVSPLGEMTRLSLYHRMIQYIADNLGQREVAAAAVARSHGISERTAQRVFAAAGDSLGDAVRRQRLDRARLDVLRSDRTLTAVAHRWGYADLSHFTRTFKDAYGYPPSELRRPDPRC